MKITIYSTHGLPIETEDSAELQERNGTSYLHLKELVSAKLGSIHLNSTFTIDYEDGDKKKTAFFLVTSIEEKGSSKEHIVFEKTSDKD